MCFSQEAIAEISETVRGGSANVSAAEYKELIRQSLTTAGECKQCFFSLGLGYHIAVFSTVFGDSI